MQVQLKSRQICLFFIAFLPVIKIFTMPSVISALAGEDLWISVLINYFIDFITLIFLLFACKFSKENFYSFLHSTFGKVGKKIILILYFAYFMLKAIIPLNEQKDYVQFTLYTLVPTLFYFLPFFFACAFFCVKRLRVLGRVGDVAWIVTIIGFLLLFALSLSNADFSAILPVGALGIKNIVKGAFKALGWFGDCVYLLFFMGEFSYKNKDGVKIALSYGLSAFFVITFTIIFYCIFTSIAFRQRFALTEISKYTTVINNTGRLDYLGIMFLLLSNVFALSIPLFFATKILSRLFNTDKEWISAIIVVLSQAVFMVLFSEFYASIERFILSYGGYFFLIFSNVLPVFFAVVVLVKNRALNFSKRSAYEKS